MIDKKLMVCWHNTFTYSTWRKAILIGITWSGMATCPATAKIYCAIQTKNHLPHSHRKEYVRPTQQTSQALRVEWISISTGETTRSALRDLWSASVCVIQAHPSILSDFLFRQRLRHTGTYAWADALIGWRSRNLANKLRGIPQKRVVPDYQGSTVSTV